VYRGSTLGWLADARLGELDEAHAREQACAFRRLGAEEQPGDARRVDAGARVHLADDFAPSGASQVGPA
jgi:hypothetical protein